MLALIDVDYCILTVVDLSVTSINPSTATQPMKIKGRSISAQRKESKFIIKLICLVCKDNSCYIELYYSSSEEIMQIPSPPSSVSERVRSIATSGRVLCLLLGRLLSSLLVLSLEARVVADAGVEVKVGVGMDVDVGADAGVEAKVEARVVLPKVASSPD